MCVHVCGLDGELGSALSRACREQVAQPQASEGVDPDERRLAPEHDPHALPARPPLPRGPLALQALDLLHRQRAGRGF